jgi:hypothetical protein
MKMTLIRFMSMRPRCRFSSGWLKVALVLNVFSKLNYCLSLLNAIIWIPDQKQINPSLVSENFQLEIPQLVPDIILHPKLDQDTFLPSAVQRYHQLFMPALQVVDAMLATLGNKHTTATHQVHIHSCDCFFFPSDIWC